jgi:hypothetical protein
VVAALLALASCKGADAPKGEHGPQRRSPDAVSLPSGATATAEPPPFGSDAVSWLGGEWMVEPPRSTSVDALPLPWRVVTPTAAQPAPPPQWTGPVVLVGRQKVYVQGEAVATVRCRAEVADLCTPEGLRDRTGRQVLDVDPASLDGDGQVRGLAAAVAARGWSGQHVILLADRRVAIGAVMQVRDTLTRGGALPHLAVAQLTGQLALLLPPQAATAVSVAADVTAVVTSGDTPAVGPLPLDVQGFVVRVLRHGVHLQLQRAGGAPAATPELLGNLVETLNVWAERTRLVAPRLTEAQVACHPEAPLEEVVRVVDAVRDTCARASKGEPCHDRRVLFSSVQLSLQTEPVAAPAAPTATAP